MRLALATDVFHTLGSPHPHFKRATTEDHALDSYQNFLFSIARFHEFTGKYPSKITIVGYEFKRARFTELHRAALRWPSNKFHYIGVDPSSDHSAVAEEGEVYVPSQASRSPSLTTIRKTTAISLSQKICTDVVLFFSPRDGKEIHSSASIPISRPH